MVIVPFAGKFMGRKFAYWSTNPPLFLASPASQKRKEQKQKQKQRGEPYDDDMTDNCLHAGWARYMEWMHNVEIRWTSKSRFNMIGAVEAAATL
ncbi:hypothetical protein SODALDRAFT_329493 [Sodiomyces alkalinus F11]|uniref:Uncharacterized protein n=1 Tax=Sodiomyces alkalinus (strain CBS 110278 / VKM F-3762 / F11) TaxID=1314773 RepID=A0A3N2PJB4_SODAK|nr:hypothetical protein SODALDRAFT_329493 [Sodiomyces alkalinus F11]ROT34628.1 hypothetical protein SODALDRAFT_329493 [Sodiomyces alkalinus F11]